MPRITDVSARPGYRLWLRYDDGVEGEVDLSTLAGRGVFRAWDAAGAFDRIKLQAHGAVAWGDAVELCPDALYLQLTGKTAAALYPSLKKTSADA